LPNSLDRTKIKPMPRVEGRGRGSDVGEELAHAREGRVLLPFPPGPVVAYSTPMKAHGEISGVVVDQVEVLHEEVDHDDVLHEEVLHEEVDQLDVV
jgi:hypothetical protein